MTLSGKSKARAQQGRWWERPRGAIQITSPEMAASPATEEASRLVTREFEHGSQSVLADFMAHGTESLEAEWLHAATISTSNARLNASQLASYARAMEAYGHRLLEEIRGEGEQEGARPVQIHFNAFPILGVPASAVSRSSRKAQGSRKANSTPQANSTPKANSTQQENPERKSHEHHFRNRFGYQPHLLPADGPRIGGSRSGCRAGPLG